MKDKIITHGTNKEYCSLFPLCGGLIPMGLPPHIQYKCSYYKNKLQSDGNTLLRRDRITGDILCCNQCAQERKSQKATTDSTNYFYWKPVYDDRRRH